MSELICASDKLLQLQELRRLEKLQSEQKELRRLQRLIDDPIIERIKRALTKAINEARHLPVTLVLKDDLYVSKLEFPSMMEPQLSSWLDIKGYRLDYRNGRGENANHVVLIVEPK